MGQAFLGAISAMQQGSSKNAGSSGSSGFARQDDPLFSFLNDYTGSIGLTRQQGGGIGGNAGGRPSITGFFLDRGSRPLGGGSSGNTVVTRQGYGAYQSSPGRSPPPR